MKKKLLATACLVAFVATSLVGCGGSKQQQPAQQEQKEPVVLKLATEMSEGSPETVAAYQFAENVKNQTNGEVVIEVYADGQLGEPATVIESAQLGNVDIVIEPASDYKTFSNIFGVEAIPYLYGNNEMVTKVLMESGIADQQKEILAENDLIVLNEARNYFRGPYRVMVSKEPINSIEDFQGLRFRTFENKNYMEAYSQLGANPIVVAWSETYTALQNGTADAATSAIGSLKDTNLIEVAPYVTNVNEYVSTILLVAGKATMDKLTDEQQAILKSCADQLGEDVASLVNENLEADIKAMEEKGAVFSDIDTKPMRQKLEGFYRSLEADGTLPEGTVDVVMAQ